MRIGVTTLFSFRPHVEHLAYLTQLLSGAGHQIHALTCDAGLSHCYSRLLRERSKLRECPRCILGGVRTFPIGRVERIDRTERAPIEPARLWRLVVSSVAVRYRTESIDYLDSPTFREAVAQLTKPVETAYANAMRWIERNRLEAVVLFNGRMDVLAGVVAACEDLGLPYVSIERPWLAHGIYMIPKGNVLDLAAIDRMCVDFRDKPLLGAQALHAGAIGAKHFLGRNRLLWRVYNADARPVVWPRNSAGARVLILPGSRNESEGHPHWVCEWGDYTTAFDHFLERTGIDATDCVLRCHPNWGERIGTFTGWRSEQHYTSWGLNRGVHVISSSSPDSTYDLITEADIVVVNGSSTGVEAALRGKQVVLIGHGTYQRSGLCSSISTPAEMEAFSFPRQHDPVAIAVRALRFMYLMASRFPQYVRFVRAKSNTRCEYFAGADAERVINMLRTAEVQPDDAEVTVDAQYEQGIAAALLAGDWSKLTEPSASVADDERETVRRRHGFGWVDELRDRMPRGDA